MCAAGCSAIVVARAEAVEARSTIGGEQQGGRPVGRACAVSVLIVSCACDAARWCGRPRSLTGQSAGKAARDAGVFARFRTFDGVAVLVVSLQATLQNEEPTVTRETV